MQAGGFSASGAKSSLFWYHMPFRRAVCHLSDSAAVQAARLWSHHPDIVVSLLKRCKGAIVGGWQQCGALLLLGLLHGCSWGRPGWLELDKSQLRCGGPQSMA